MGRKVRKVPKNWKHPKNYSNNFKPLYDNYILDLKNFARNIQEKGLEEALEYCGGGPVKENYMPVWKPGECTHLMMYETCSEGTPISPSFETPEELAHWLADTGASSFAGMTATYEQWLNICKGDYACSAVVVNEKMISGVEAATVLKEE